MPAGSKRPYTKETKLQIASNKAEKDFKDNRNKFDSARKRARDHLDPFAVGETYVRAFKDSGKRKKMEAAKKTAAASPTGTKSKTIISKSFPKDVTNGWREISKKDGIFKVK